MYSIYEYIDGEWKLNMIVDAHCIARIYMSDPDYMVIAWGQQ